MPWLNLSGELILGFILGTLVLWMCSLTVKTDKANFKTAAIYNGIMMILTGVLLAIGLIFLHTQSGIAGLILIAFTVLTLIASFWLLMRLYDISILATIWLFIAMWAVGVLAQKLMTLVA